jgi:hypothetical protein
MSLNFDYSSIIDSANEDGEFKIAARFWDAIVRLDVGEQSHIMRVRDGRLVSLYKCDSAGAAGYDIRISAPESDWEELLRPVPQPFYQDLMAASWRHGFRVEGHVIEFYPYYRAINRLFELIREQHRG